MVHCAPTRSVRRARAPLALQPSARALTHAGAEERDEWLRSVYDAGVRNFEMEVRPPGRTHMPHRGDPPLTCMQALLLAAFCQEMGIPAVILCTVLVDRLRGDQLRISQHEVCSPRLLAGACGMLLTRRRRGSCRRTRCGWLSGSSSTLPSCETWRCVKQRRQNTCRTSQR